MNNLVLTQPGRSARKPKSGGHERRGEILVAAAKIFNSLGYEGATIRRIAEEVGPSSTALYMHFRDKDEMLVEICEGALEALLRLGSDIAAQPLPPVERARHDRSLCQFRAFGTEHLSPSVLQPWSAPLAAQ